jgi:hypothetical protein
VSGPEPAGGVAAARDGTNDVVPLEAGYYAAAQRWIASDCERHSVTLGASSRSEPGT